MHLETLVSIAEDGPWCGTRPLGCLRLHPSLEASWDNFASRPESRRHEADVFSQSRHEVFGPAPDPWRLGAIEVGLYGAVTLYQMGHRLSGAAAEGIRSAAVILFDEICGTVPLPELIWVLLHRPPPPSPPWLSTLVFAGQMLAFAQAAQQQDLARAASRQIAVNLEALGLHVQTEHARAVA